MIPQPSAVLPFDSLAVNSGVEQAINLRSARAVSTIIQHGRRTLVPIPRSAFHLTHQTRFALAAEVARDLTQTNVDVAHVLVGLLRERLNIGAKCSRTKA